MQHVRRRRARVSQLATSSSSRPVTTKLAASTQAKLAISGGVGPNRLTTMVEIDRPAISSTASRRSIPAESAVQRPHRAVGRGAGDGQDQAAQHQPADDRRHRREEMRLGIEDEQQAGERGHGARRHRERPRLRGAANRRPSRSARPRSAAPPIMSDEIALPGGQQRRAGAEQDDRDAGDAKRRARAFGPTMPDQPGSPRCSPMSAALRTSDGPLVPLRRPQGAMTRSAFLRIL